MKRSATQRASQPLLGGIPVLAVAGALLIIIAGCGGAPNPLESPLDTPTPDRYATKLARVTLEMQTKEARATLVLTLTPSTPRPRPTGTPESLTFAPVPDGTPAGMGVIAPASGPFSSIQYHLENEWIEDIEGATKRIEVFAGADSDPVGRASQQGVAVILATQRVIENNPTVIKVIDSGRYPTPCQGGSVHVTGAVGDQLILQSTSGKVFYFDVPSRQFIDALGTPTPTPTPDPNSDTWTFSGDVGDGTGDPPPCSDITLYAQEGNTWQAVAETTPSSDGTFTLRYTGPRTPRRFLISVQYPPGFDPALPVAGPGFVVVDNNAIMSVPALGPGNYGGHRFRNVQPPFFTPRPGTRTPPPLPTPPPGTWTPPPPTMVSPLATPTP